MPHRNPKDALFHEVLHRNPSFHCELWGSEVSEEPFSEVTPWHTSPLVAPFEEYAYHWDRHWTQDNWIDFPWFLSQLAKLEKIPCASFLELGCATGIQAVAALQHIPRVIAVDSSEACSRIARSRCGYPGIEFHHADYKDLDLKTTVDAGFSSGNTLNYIQNREELHAIFRRIALHLVEGGTFAFHTQGSEMMLLLSGKQYRYCSLLGPLIIQYRFDPSKKKQSKLILSEAFQEQHELVAWDETDIVQAVKGTGLRVEAVLKHRPQNATSDIPLLYLLRKSTISSVKSTSTQHLSAAASSQGNQKWSWKKWRRKSAISRFLHDPPDVPYSENLRYHESELKQPLSELPQITADNLLTPYSNLAKYWRQIEEAQCKENFPLLLSRLAKLDCLPFRSVLDLGCGTGVLCQVAAKLVRRVVGIDRSQSMLDYARLHNPSSRIEYTQADFQSLHLGQKFDGAYSAGNCLNYLNDVDDLKEVFRQVAEHLNPSARFIFDANNSETMLASSTRKVKWLPSGSSVEISFSYSPKQRKQFARVITVEGCENHDRVPIEAADICRLVQSTGLEVEEIIHGWKERYPFPFLQPSAYILRKV